MSAVSPITRQTVGRTFIVAISVLGVGAVAQLAVIVWFFFARFHAAPTPEPSSLASRTFVDPFAESSSLAPPAPGARLAVTPPPKPTPISQAALAPSTVPTEKDRFNDMIEQARALRDRGDTYAAVTKLREAQATEPRNPQASAELAMTYEKMGAVEKAAEAWRRVYDMGESGGIYYEAARTHLKESEMEAQKAALVSISSGGAETGAPAASAAPAADSVGLGPNCKLGLQAPAIREEKDPTAARKFSLLVPVQAKARARIDVRDVIVQVMFYDVVNGKALDHTSAQVSYKWTAPPADWSDTDVETLEVSYFLPAQHVSDEDRKYYGYIVSLYYKNALQDFRSDPPALAERLKPKRVLAPESE